MRKRSDPRIARSRQSLRARNPVGGPRVRTAVLYGSRAKGNYQPGSDVDLCLDAPTLDFSTLVNIENQIDDLLLLWKFDITVRQKLTNSPLLEHIDRVGIVLHRPAISVALRLYKGR